MPNKVEFQQLKLQIDQYKKEINDNLDTLKRLKENNGLLKIIMDDWKPRNYIDQIAISEAFNLYGQSKKYLSEFKNQKKILTEKMKDIKEKFEEHEMKTSHPYIKFQKARVFSFFLGLGLGDEYIISIINDCYEKAILAIENEYNYIQYTKSYAAMLWLYGIFLAYREKDISRAIKYLEKAKNSFEELQINDSSYYKMLATLFRLYFRIYKKKQVMEYIDLAQEIYESIGGEENVNISELEKRFNYKINAILLKLK